MTTLKKLEATLYRYSFLKYLESSDGYEELKSEGDWWGAPKERDIEFKKKSGHFVYRCGYKDPIEVMFKYIRDKKIAPCFFYEEKDVSSWSQVEDPYERGSPVVKNTSVNISTLAAIRETDFPAYIAHVSEENKKLEKKLKDRLEFYKNVLREKAEKCLKKRFNSAVGKGALLKTLKISRESPRSISAINEELALGLQIVLGKNSALKTAFNKIIEESSIKPSRAFLQEYYKIAAKNFILARGLKEAATEAGYAEELGLKEPA